jgi:hypothetical protein
MPLRARPTSTTVRRQRQPTTATRAGRGRGRGTTRSKTKKQRRCCELGTDCPYKDEYQHSLEFAHDNSSERTDAAETAPTFRPFAGTGRTTMSASSSSSLVMGRSGGNTSSVGAVMQQQITPATTTVSSSRQAIDLTSDPSETTIEPSDRKRAASRIPPGTGQSVIDLCDDDDDDEEDEKVVNQNRRQRLPSPPVAETKRRRTDQEVLSPSWGFAVSEEEERRQLAHAMAASNRDVLSQQDAEYYESLRQDQAKELAKKQEEDRIRDEDNLRRAMEESAQNAQSDMERNAAQELLHHEALLEPEPPESENTATIAFRLPSQCSTTRLIRRFHTTACADQLTTFLKSCEQLASVRKWTLRNVIGGSEILPTQSLRDLGLVPRGMVVVWDEGE